jgi:hypothetical protein
MRWGMHDEPASASCRKLGENPGMQLHGLLL